jgi:hypothetical protein
MNDIHGADQEGLRDRPGRALVPRLRRLRRAGAGPEADADARHPARELRLHLRHRLLQPLSVLHGNLRHAQHPRPRAGHRQRPQAGAARAVGVGGDRRRRRAGHRRQPLHPRHAAQRRPEDPPVQQPHLRPHQGPVQPDLRAGQEDQDHAAWQHRPALQPGRRGAGRRRHLRRPHGGQRPRPHGEACSSAPPSTRARPSSRSTRTASSSTTAPTMPSPTRACATTPACCSSTASRSSTARSATRDLVVHDEAAEHSGLAFFLSQFDAPKLPVPLGVFRAVSAPSYEEMNNQLHADAREVAGGAATWPHFSTAATPGQSSKEEQANGFDDYRRMHQLRRVRAGVPEQRHLAGRRDLCHRRGEMHRVRRPLRRIAVRRRLSGRLHRHRSELHREQGTVARQVPQADRHA